MKRSSRAALLSGLVFPGLGHISLKKYLRGFALIATSLVALAVIVTTAYQQAQLIVDQMASGQIPMETGAIAQAVSDSGNTTSRLIDNIALYVLVACWLIGIVDAYRLGGAAEKQEE